MTVPVLTPLLNKGNLIDAGILEALEMRPQLLGRLAPSFQRLVRRAALARRAASLIVSRLEQATQTGGCGFCSGFGMTFRQGMEKYLPSCPG